MTEQEWMKRFASNLLLTLDEYGMTQRELSDASGISEGTISKYVNAIQMPSLIALINISYVFGCSVEELIDFGEKIE